ncbi:hypothetical protein AB0P21_03670 [Kribbella sp. NPDC056861]
MSRPSTGVLRERVAELLRAEVDPRWTRYLELLAVVNELRHPG